MKKITLSLQLIVFIILCPLLTYAGNLTDQEVGDVVFRDLQWWPFEKHSAIYVGYTNGDPETDSNHDVVEEEGPEIYNDTRQISLQQFKNDAGPLGTYHGAMRFGFPGKGIRNGIRQTAINHIGLDYTNDWRIRGVWWTDGEGGPQDGILQPNELRGLRSDAFIEYVYALNGRNISHDIINDPDWYNILDSTGLLTEFTPNDQYNNMDDAFIDDPLPAHDLYSPSHYDAIDQWTNPQSQNTIIEAQWQSSGNDDMLSGLHSYYVHWSDEPDTHIGYFANTEVVTAIDGSATYTVNSTNFDNPMDDGRWWIHIRTVDKAGNWDQAADGEASTAHFGPFHIDTLPPLTVTNLAPSSPHELATWSNNAYITTTWTAAVDDTTYTIDVSGVDGYGTEWNTSSSSLPDETKDIEEVTSTTGPELPDGVSHYFHIRSTDNAGNWDDEAVSIGPFWIDATAPSISITILREDEEYIPPDGTPWVIGRLFGVSVTDPIINNARSGLESIIINGVAQEVAYGSASWYGEFYVETPAWIRVTAKDVAGNEAYADDENPDPYFIQAPRWEDVHDLDIPFDDYAISPITSLGVQDDVFIDYELVNPAHILIRIYSETGELVKITRDSYEDTPGTHSFIWDGTNVISEVVPDGNYYYVAEGVDYLSDSLVLDDYGLIIVDNTLATVTIENSFMDMPKWGYLTLEVDISEVSLDDILVSYKLSTSGTYDSVTPRKRELIDGKWNIELDTSDWPDGLYDIKIEARDFAGNTGIDVMQVNIQRETTTTVEVYDIRTGISYQTTPYSAYIKYFLSRQANVTIGIYTQGMSFVKEITNEIQTFGKHTVYWDGTNAGGYPVPGGQYKYKITSSDDPTLSEIGNITYKRVKSYISSPWQDSLARAYVPIKGHAHGQEFQSYKLEFGEGKDPTFWETIIESTTPVYSDVLAYWDTGYNFEAYCSPQPYPYEGIIGDYTLRLTVTDINSNEYASTINVVVGRVISNEEGGEGRSPDDKVHLIVEPLSIYESHEVVAIMPADIPEIIPQDKTIIGQVYELRPPMLGFATPQTLTMSYTTEDLGAHDESKLGIYLWDILKKRWRYLETEQNTTDDILTTQIKEIPRYHAYIAIASDETIPQPPIIFEPISPIHRLSAHIFGIAESQDTVELFNNGTPKETLDSEYNYGWFSTYLKDLGLGSNVFTAKSTDPAGNESPVSSPQTIVVELHEPSSVLSIGLKTPDFSGDYAGSSVQVGDTLYIELEGIDSSASTVDIAQIKLATSISNPTGIVISLTETGENTGIYRGIAFVGTRSDEANRTIGAVNNETLTISSVQDPGVYITIDVESTELIDAPYCVFNNPPLSMSGYV